MSELPKEDIGRWRNGGNGMKKRLLALVLGVTMAAMSLTGCGTVGGKQETSTEQSQTTTDAAESTDTSNTQILLTHRQQKQKRVRYIKSVSASS